MLPQQAKLPGGEERTIAELETAIVGTEPRQIYGGEAGGSLSAKRRVRTIAELKWR